MIRGNFGNQGTVPKGQCIQQNLKSQNTPYNNNMNQALNQLNIYPNANNINGYPIRFNNNANNLPQQFDQQNPNVMQINKMQNTNYMGLNNQNQKFLQALKSNNPTTLENNTSSKLQILNNFIPVLQQQPQYVELSNELNFTYDCILRQSHPNYNWDSFTISYKNEIFEEKKTYNCDVLRIGRKKDEMILPKRVYHKVQNIEYLEIQEKKLSRCHCDIINFSGQLKIADCKTINGTYKVLDKSEKCIMNKELVFYFMNVKFTVKMFYNISNAPNTIFLCIMVGEENSNCTINISSVESSKQPVYLSHLSTNVEVKNIFVNILDQCKEDLLQYSDENFPFIIYENGKFFIYSQKLLNKSELLIKLLSSDDNDKYYIDFNEGDKFNLGGETTICLEKLNSNQEVVQNNQFENTNYLCQNNCQKYAEVMIKNCQHIFCSCCIQFNFQSNPGLCLCGNQIIDVVLLWDN